MRYNYKYGKLENGALTYAPNKLIIQSKDKTKAQQIFNAPAETYKAYGWLPIIKTENPEAEEGFYYLPFYTKENNSIVQQWEKIENPKDDYTLTLNEKDTIIDILSGEGE